jgi:hypothetical protein
VIIQRRHDAAVLAYQHPDACKVERGCLIIMVKLTQHPQQPSVINTLLSKSAQTWQAAYLT